MVFKIELNLFVLLFILERKNINDELLMMTLLIIITMIDIINTYRIWINI